MSFDELLEAYNVAAQAEFFIDDRHEAWDVGYTSLIHEYVRGGEWPVQSARYAVREYFRTNRPQNGERLESHVDPHTPPIGLEQLEMISDPDVRRAVATETLTEDVECIRST